MKNENIELASGYVVKVQEETGRYDSWECGDVEVVAAFETLADANKRAMEEFDDRYGFDRAEFDFWHPDFDAETDFFDLDGENGAERDEENHKVHVWVVHSDKIRRKTVVKTVIEA